MPLSKHVTSKMIVTVETCPVCQSPGMKVEHGITDERHRFVHVESCPECGNHYPIVGYKCQFCIEASKQPTPVITEEKTT